MCGTAQNKPSAFQGLSRMAGYQINKCFESEVGSGQAKPGASMGPEVRGYSDGQRIEVSLQKPNTLGWQRLLHTKNQTKTKQKPDEADQGSHMRC